MLSYFTEDEDIIKVIAGFVQWDHIIKQINPLVSDLRELFSYPIGRYVCIYITQKFFKQLEPDQRLQYQNFINWNSVGLYYNVDYEFFQQLDEPNQFDYITNEVIIRKCFTIDELIKIDSNHIISWKYVYMSYALEEKDIDAIIDCYIAASDFMRGSMDLELLPKYCATLTKKQLHRIAEYKKNRQDWLPVNCI